MGLLEMIIILVVIATVATFAAGIFAMGHGGEFDDKHRTQLMFARVGLQGVHWCCRSRCSQRISDQQLGPVLDRSRERVIGATPQSCLVGHNDKQ